MDRAEQARSCALLLPCFHRRRNRERLGTHPGLMRTHYDCRMTLPREKRTELTAWSKAVRSSCYVYRASDVGDLTKVMDEARRGGTTLIAHGAGHSYTDAAMNTNAIVLDVTPMRGILAWDPASGMMEVEAGATLGDVIETACRSSKRWPNEASPSRKRSTRRD